MNRALWINPGLISISCRGGIRTIIKEPSTDIRGIFNLRSDYGGVLGSRRVGEVLGSIGVEATEVTISVYYSPILIISICVCWYLLISSNLENFINMPLPSVHLYMLANAVRQVIANTALVWASTEELYPRYLDMSFSKNCRPAHTYSCIFVVVGLEHDNRIIYLNLVSLIHTKLLKNPIT
jgi:hypothetical protein